MKVLGIYTLDLLYCILHQTFLKFVLSNQSAHKFRAFDSEPSRINKCSSLSEMHECLPCACANRQLWS